MCPYFRIRRNEDWSTMTSYRKCDALIWVHKSLFIFAIRIIILLVSLEICDNT